MKRLLLRLTGLAFCVAPPALTALEHFPVWLGDGRKAVSALALFLLLLCVLPLWKQIKRLLASPSLWTVWLILWLFLSLFAPLVEGLTAVAFMGFLGGVPGAICLRLADKPCEK